jgi:hypothetical protein
MDNESPTNFFQYLLLYKAVLAVVRLLIINYC